MTCDTKTLSLAPNPTSFCFMQQLPLVCPLVQPVHDFQCILYCVSPHSHLLPDSGMQVPHLSAPHLLSLRTLAFDFTTKVSFSLKKSSSVRFLRSEQQSSWSRVESVCHTIITPQSPVLLSISKQKETRLLDVTQSNGLPKEVKNIFVCCSLDL